MGELAVRSIDPRDQRREVARPKFRVYFWRRAGMGWASNEFEVTGGDVDEVIEWARERAYYDEVFTLYCCVESVQGLGLVRLLGEDPTSP
jgi:hypothetical protein